MSAGLTVQWQALTEQPMAFVRERCISECLVHDLASAELAQMRESPRFASRLEGLLNDHFGLQPLAQLPLPAEQDLPVMLLSERDFAHLPRLCGAVWHAATLTREIRGQVVAEYRQLLGEDTFAFALVHRHLAGAADLLRTPADLAQAIDRDGAACVSTWLAGQPANLRAWLQLRVDYPEPDQPGDQRQVCVVQIVAAHLMTRAQGNDHE
ncbi:type III secretion protein [Pseudomonas alliivorans]|nr:type III secretion protein [Pseudomonas alliivorans]MEE4965102.1 type III secretion protein [Pseudomonas alliivorans]MEE4985448.1 type III secretion protein [Pseudomonas alliivorans]MEE4990534.1 type III secretion protein [Pseudomonas alliivorans]MEE5005567.1 type III secretion protein [Pseudomonas alliivorans]